MLRPSKRIVLALSLVGLLLLTGQSNAQDEAAVIEVSPLVGKLIDREERDTYGLFQGYSDFQSAVFMALPDGSYGIRIAYLEKGQEKVQTWIISKQDLLFDYKRLIEAPVMQKITVGPKRKCPVLRVETEDGQRLTGSLRRVSDDLLTLDLTDECRSVNADGQRSMANIRLDSIASLTVTRKSSFLNGIALGLLPGAIGALIGYSSGDDPPGLFSCSAEAKAACGLIVLGGLGVSIGGTIEALKGVDVDIPLEKATLEERRAILSRLQVGRYPSRGAVRFSPWASTMSTPYGTTARAIGGMVRFHFNPRSGLEISYGRTNWFDVINENYTYSSYTERYRIEMASAGFFVSTDRSHSIIPSLSWGWGRISRRIAQEHRYQSNGGSSECQEWSYTYGEKCLCVYFDGGLEIPLCPWISLEGRVRDLIDLCEGQYVTTQVGLVIGSPL